MSANFPEIEEDFPDQPSDFSNRALVRIRTEGLTLTPEMFDLWYSYYAGTSPDITRSIDILVASGQEITDLRCADVLESLPSKAVDENQELSETGEKVRDTLDNIGKAVGDMNAANADYRNHLTDASSEIDNNPDNVKSVLQGLLTKTKKMAEQGAKLDEILAYSADTINDIQRAMTDAQKEALTDSLTRIANRKAFDAKLLELLSGENVDEGDNRDGFCLIIFDIDNFKSFNDAYGHQIGDHVLRLVANVLVDGIKGRDMAARYGGEEFAVLLPRTSAKGGIVVANALREAVGNKELLNKTTGEKLGQITLSAGVCFGNIGDDAADIVKLADEALYKAKCNGRNQVVESKR